MKIFTNRPNLVVIGNGMVGHKFLEQCVELGLNETYQITTFCEEPQFAYDRVQLSTYFNTRNPNDLSLVDASFYQDHHITVHLNDKATSIDRTSQTVTSDKGVLIHYDKLILATGSYPFVPPIEGNDLNGCFVYRTIEDLEAITAAAEAQGSRVGAVVGGGLLGLEAAKALNDLGLKTHVVEFAPRLMAVQIDDAGGAILRKKIESLGVDIHTHKNTTRIEKGKEHAMTMQFADGESLDTDIILFSAGIRPRDDIAKEAELALGPRGGIVIDNHCITSDANIYAIGECALWNNKIFGLVAPGYQMAEVAAKHLAWPTRHRF